MAGSGGKEGGKSKEVARNAHASDCVGAFGWASALNPKKWRAGFFHDGGDDAEVDPRNPGAFGIGRGVM